MEEIQLILNHKVEDYTVVVDLETAEILLNDPEEANTFISKLTQQAEGDESSCSTMAGSSNPIWKSNGKSTKEDEKGTSFLLQLREQYASKFDDKKTNKLQLWAMIAEELRKAGYYCGIGKEGAERRRQKFSNLQKQYIHHKNHMHKTGEEKKEKKLILLIYKAVSSLKVMK